MKLLSALILTLPIYSFSASAQVVDPATLARETSGRTVTLEKPFKLELDHGSITWMYELGAGKYQAEYVGELGTFYRGPPHCLTTSSYKAALSSHGSSFGPDRKADCGILIDKNGGVTIYQYPRKLRSRELQASNKRLADRAAVQRVAETVESQYGKILLLNGMEPSSDLSKALIRE